MTTTTPGRRLHAALLAHRRGIDDEWGDLGRVAREQYEAAAREYDGEGIHETERALCWRVESASGWGDEGCVKPWCRKCPPTRDRTAAETTELHDRLDALAAEVAALRRDRDHDLAAMGEAGDRLSRIEADLADLEPTLSEVQGRLARCEGRDGEVVERLGKLEADLRRHRSVAGDDANQFENRIDGLYDRVAALEARAIDGGDPLRRTG